MRVRSARLTIAAALASIVVAAMAAPSPAEPTPPPEALTTHQPDATSLAVSTTDLDSAACVVPHVRFDHKQVAATRVTNAGLVPVFLSSGTWVLTQSPVSGTRVECGSAVKMRLAPGEVP